MKISRGFLGLRWVCFVLAPLFFLWACAPSSKTNNKNEILSRLFATSDLSGIAIQHFVLIEGGMGDTGKIVAQLAMSKEKFFLLMKSCHAEKLDIPRGDGPNAYGRYQFDRDVRINLPDYAAEKNGIPIHEIQTVYKIVSNLDVPKNDKYSGVPRKVDSHVVVDDRVATTYTLFLSISPYIAHFATR